MKILAIDASSLFFRVAAANRKYAFGSDEEKANLALHSSIITANKYFKRFKPDRVVFAFEGRNNWRKQYTASDECISKVAYKGSRNGNDPAIAAIINVISSMQEVMSEHTSIACLSVEESEADDVIAVLAQEYSENDEIVIVSSDKDFTQLLKHKNVKLIDPGSDKARECDNPSYFMFEKCVRGDGGDDVPSAFPRVRKTRIEKAFTDPYERVQFMNEEIKIIDPVSKEEIGTATVGERFEENKLLMDLECQPDRVRNRIKESIKRELENPNQYDHFKILQYFGSIGLFKISENIQDFVPMFNANRVALTAKPVEKTVQEQQTDSLLAF